MDGHPRAASGRVRTRQGRARQGGAPRLRAAGAAMPPPQQWGDVCAAVVGASVYAELPDLHVQHREGEGRAGESEYPNGFTATMPYPDSQQTLGKAAALAGPNLKQIGITLNVQAGARRTRGSRRSTRTPGPRRADHQLGRRLPGSGGRAALHLRQRGRNEEQLQHRELQEREDGQAAAHRSRTPSTRRARRAVSERVRSWRARDVPYIPIWYQQVAMALEAPSTRSGSALGTCTHPGSRRSRPSDIRIGRARPPALPAAAMTFDSYPTAFVLRRLGGAGDCRRSRSRSSSSACSTSRRAAPNSCCSANSKPSTPETVRAVRAQYHLERPVPRAVPPLGAERGPGSTSAVDQDERAGRDGIWRAALASRPARRARVR